MKQPSTLDIIQIQMRLMKMSSLWPKVNETFVARARFSAIFLVTLIGISTMAMQCVYVRNDYAQLSKIFSVAISAWCYKVKLIIYMLNKKRYLHMMRPLDASCFKYTPACFGHHILEGQGLSRVTSIAYQGSCAIVVIALTLKPFDTKDHEMPLPFTIYDMGWYKYLFGIFQGISIAFAAWNNSCFDTVSAGFMLIGSAHLKMFHDQLVRMREWADVPDHKWTLDVHNLPPSNDEQINIFLGRCVEHHIAITKFLKHVNKIFSHMFLGQFIASKMVICNSGFQLAHEPDVVQLTVMFVYFVAMMIQLALYCWFGNDLTENSAKLKDACYLSNWHECGTSVKKSLFIIMERAKQPTSMNAGKFANLSLGAFSSILRSSYSYFALLQSLYKKQTSRVN